MNNERAHNESTQGKTSVTEVSTTMTILLLFLWVACSPAGAIVEVVCVGRVEPVAYKDLNDASGKKESSDYDLGLVVGADFVALRREEDDNQTLTDERNNYSSCSIRRSISLN